MTKYKFFLKGLDCASCAHKIEDHLSQDPSLKRVVINFSTSKLSFESDYAQDINKYVQKKIWEVEPDVIIVEKDSYEHLSIFWDCVRILFGVILLVISTTILKEKYKFIILIISYAILLYRIALKAFKQLIKGIVDENLLITISCIGAYIIGEHLEGAIVIILYEIGKILENLALNKSRKSITSLMKIKAETATLLSGEIVRPDDVKIDDIIIVKPGERVPLDGIIIDGNSHLDTSSLSGESKQMKVGINDNILSGSINIDGLLHVKVTATYQNSTVAKILELVETATDKKTHTETFVDRLSRIYTPVVILLAVMVGIFLPLCFNVPLYVSIYRALTFLVIACPCAIVISVPLSYFSGIGIASRHGILIKGSNFLDELRNVDEIVFDKTGTLTYGEFAISSVSPIKGNEEEILNYAVAGERLSNHPIAKSIVESYPNYGLDIKVSDYKEIAGQGIIYSYNNHEIKIGNSTLVAFSDMKNDCTKVFVSIDDNVLGYINIGDEIKKESFSLINGLGKMRIKVSMFTGDDHAVAKAVATKLNITDYRSNMLPTDKYHELEQKLNKKRIIAFVGDGVNDAPVIALADIGISMGNGSAAAIDASDIVIVSDNLNKLLDALHISQYTHHIIKQNLFFAILCKIVILCLGIFGFASMWSAIFADVGVTLITIFNSLRIMKH